MTRFDKLLVLRRAETLKNVRPVEKRWWRLRQDRESE